MGLDMIQGDHEDAPGQLELNFTFDDRAAHGSDRLTTYRQICAQVARENNLDRLFHVASPSWVFQPRAAAITTSRFWRGGEDVAEPAWPRFRRAPRHGRLRSRIFRKGGENKFLPDSDDVARSRARLDCMSIGGIVINHLNALTAIGCSTVNSYRRLWDTGLLGAGVRRLGLSKSHLTGLRVSAPGRFEYRSVDSMVNPLSHGRARSSDGVRRWHPKKQLDPGEPEERNIYQAMEAGKQVKKLPMISGRRAWTR